MKLLYIGCFVEPSQEFFISQKAKAQITVSTTTFQKAFLSGFQYYDLNPEIINIPDIGSWPKRCRKIFIPSSYSNYKGLPCYNLGFCNITYVKQYHIYNVLKRSIYTWIKNHDNEEVTIVVYSCIYHYLKPIIDVKKEFKNVRVCCIVLDLPEYFGDSNSLLTKLVSKNVQTYELFKSVDSFILLTPQMAEKINVGKRPWMLMEGIYNPNIMISPQNKRKAILYTGKLDARFGIRDLVDNFIKLKDEDIELWICGNGTDTAYVKAKAVEDKRVKYYGLLKQEKVFQLQQEASLLINPRKPEGEYTKYSFPSKTMEYMASGTPTIMYALPGMPDEYKHYLILLHDNGENMLEVMEEWLNKSQKELEDFGKRAKEFILNNKTSRIQIERFVNFITSINEK